MPSACELAGLKPDVIVGFGGSALLRLKEATKTIPIVFAQASDPVGGGFVPSLTRPGGNITGFALYEYAIVVKWLELLKQDEQAAVRSVGKSVDGLHDVGGVAQGRPMTALRTLALCSRSPATGRGLSDRPDRRAPQRDQSTATVLMPISAPIKALV
jgi:ABC transporter substrate binding protein